MSKKQKPDFTAPEAGAPAMGKRPKANPKVLWRVMKMLFHYYPVLMPLTVLCILIAAVTAAIPSLFMQQVIAVIEEATVWDAATKAEIVKKVALLAGFYAFSLVAVILQTQLIAVTSEKA